ncbi:hypothetical protein SXCC_00528 [Gluconacetobacter sp. SXCC-1]|nr:hypothetical protein SXCC_00528 [Gluconacetobacter sp. SXCC-1]
MVVWIITHSVLLQDNHETVHNSAIWKLPTSIMKLPSTPIPKRFTSPYAACCREQMATAGSVGIVAPTTQLAKSTNLNGLQSKFSLE